MPMTYLLNAVFFLPFLGDGKMSTRYEEALKVEPFFQSELGR